LKLWFADAELEEEYNGHNADLNRGLAQVRALMMMVLMMMVMVMMMMMMMMMMMLMMVMLMMMMSLKKSTMGTTQI